MPLCHGDDGRHGTDDGEEIDLRKAAEVIAGMYLNGDVAGQLAIELLIHFNDLFRGDRFCEINLGFHENSS